MRRPGSAWAHVGRTGPAQRSAVPVAALLLAVTACDSDVADGGADAADSAFSGYVTRTGFTYGTMEPWIRMTEGQPGAVRDEMAALHFAAAVFAIAGLPWSEDRKRAEIDDVRRRLAADMAPGSGRTEAAWERYLEERAPAYVAVVPADYDPFTVLSKDDLRRMGAVLVEGVLSHPTAPAEPPFGDEDWALAAGSYLRWRVFQVMRALEDMP